MRGGDIPVKAFSKWLLSTGLNFTADRLGHSIACENQLSTYIRNLVHTFRAVADICLENKIKN